MGCRTTYISEGTTIHLYVVASRTTEVKDLRYRAVANGPVGPAMAGPIIEPENFI